MESTAVSTRLLGRVSGAAEYAVRNVHRRASAAHEREVRLAEREIQALLSAGLACYEYEAYNVRVADRDVEALVTADGTWALRWIRTTRALITASTDPPVVGLGVQWAPTPRYPQGQLPPPATLQLCFNDRCLIYQVAHANYVPDELGDFLGAPGIAFVSHGMQADRRMLRDHLNLTIESGHELRAMAGMGNLSIERMADAVLGYPGIRRDRRVSMSEWQAPQLSSEQVQYACLDAYLCFRIARRVSGSYLPLLRRPPLRLGTAAPAPAPAPAVGQMPQRSLALLPGTRPPVLFPPRAPPQAQGAPVPHAGEPAAPAAAAAAARASSTTSSQLHGLDILFKELIQTGDLQLERKLVDQLITSDAYTEYMELSDPSSDEDDVDKDPDYTGGDDNMEEGSDNGGYDDADEKDGDDEQDDVPEDDAEEEEEDEEEEEEEEDEDEDDPDYIPVEEEEDEEDDSEDEDEEDDSEDEDYIPVEEEQSVYPAPEIKTAHGKAIEAGTIFARINRDTHVLDFGETNVLQKIRLWRQGRRRGFEFVPSETLRRIWRLDVLLRGGNPGNPKHAIHEPPVPNPGDYDEEGWSDMEESMFTTVLMGHRLYTCVRWCQTGLWPVSFDVNQRQSCASLCSLDKYF